jgi:hypothetical protein
MGTHKEQIIEPTPSLQTILAQYGGLSLQNYAQQEYHGIVSEDTVFLWKKQEFLLLFKKYTKDEFGDEIAGIVTDSLEKNYCVSTGDHQGPLGHPFFFHSALLRWLVRPYEAIVNLCASNVSLGNSSYPRGIVFHGDGENTTPGTYLHLPFFGAKDRMRPLYWLPPYWKDNVYKYILPKLEKYRKEKVITEEQAKHIELFIERSLLSEQILNVKSYSKQCTLLNFYWWREIFQESLPPFIGLDGEDLTSYILVEQINESHIFPNTFLSVNWQSEIEKLFNGIGCCFDIKSKHGTYLFWHLDANGKRQPLWRSGDRLITDDGAFNIKIDANIIAEYLQSKTLIPSWLLVYTLLACYYKLTCFGGIFQAEYLTQIQRQYNKLNIEQEDSVNTQSDIINADLYYLYSTPTTPLTAMDYQHHPEYLPITIDTLSQITLKTALENSLADICGVNFHLLYPAGNLTALVEIKPANQAYKEKIERLIYEKFPEVEQVGFIYTENKQHVLEMTGNEMCVNATLSYFHLCFLREKEVTNIFVKWPDCYLEWYKKTDNSICLKFPEIDSQNIEHNLTNNTHIVRLPGIVHIFTHNKEHDKELLAVPHLKSDNALGVSFVDNREDTTKLRTHIFLSHIGIFREETSCGSWTIAYGALMAKKQGSISEQISQLSGQNSHITATIKDDWYIKLQITNEVEYRGIYML